MRILRIALLLLTLAVASLWLAGGAQASDPNGTQVRSAPAANQVLATAPTSIDIAAASGVTTGRSRY